jgi:hypothetical protein
MKNSLFAWTMVLGMGLAGTAMAKATTPGATSKKAAASDAAVAAKGGTAGARRAHAKASAAPQAKVHAAKGQTKRLPKPTAPTEPGMK